MERIDDADLTRITYLSEADGWRQRTGRDDREWNLTSHGTSKAGSYAIFKFNGTYVEVRGMIRPKPHPLTDKNSINTFTLDGREPFVYQPRTFPNRTLYNELLYRSQPLQDTEHTLVMTCTVETGWLWLDYIDYTPSNTSTIAIQPSSEASSRGGTLLSKGAVAAVALGAAIITALVVGGALWCWKRREKRRLKSKSQLDDHVTPFEYPEQSPTSVNQTHLSYFSFASYPSPQGTRAHEKSPRTFWNISPTGRCLGSWRGIGRMELDYSFPVRRRCPSLFEVYNSTCNMNIEGKSISVYGTLSGNQSTVNPIDLFVLDGGAPVTFAPGLNGTWLYHQRLYSSPTLRDGPHTLVMNRTVDNSDVFIDYFDITPSDPNATTSQSNPLSTSESGTGTEGLSSGAITGIAIAISLVLLGCLGLLVWLSRSRRRAVNGTGTADTQNRPFLDVTSPSMTTARSQSATMPDSDWSRSGSTAGTSGANTQKGPAFQIMNDTGEAGPSVSETPPPYRKHA
ncbi:hypothetical protein Moror_8415 [Moniliophthora roreri MCA 2997]|uniref:Uncharacterized protein n=1 Tax=Moniliophthora roreri (strain MCA 2997) TaxID=1381753 RepID=V2XRC7_MONRO|nr:hypothetical protein Moror_8415 [Moniliophthora roreri MCA 2997]